jgi:leucyl-tRNA synthetase
LFFDEKGNLVLTEDEPTRSELKTLHHTIRKVQDDIERFSFNTAVSQFMICVNELTEMKCHNRKILEKLVIVLSSYAPHIGEELWLVLGKSPSVADAAYPEFVEEYVRESTFEYPVSFNGKMRFKLELPKDINPQEIEKKVLADERSSKWIEGKQVRKVIVVPNKIINIVHT